MSLFHNQVFLGTLMILLSVLVHVTGLVWSADGLMRLGQRIPQRFGKSRSMTLLMLGMVLIIVLHMTEALGWALLYRALGEFDDLEKALYFSVTTATTLGYGDITLSPEWQLLSTFEAIAGLLLFGAGTAFLLGLMREMFGHLDPKTPQRHG